MNGKRMISQFDLADKLRQYEKWGVQVPVLNNSLMMPVYNRTESDGTEVYDHFTRVKQGQVIDDHGTVVDMAALDQELHQRMFDRQSR